MKFIKGKKYKLIKSKTTRCYGCIMKYKGIDKYKKHYGIPVKSKCTYKDCSIFQKVLDDKSGVRELVEHISMVEFCKRLRKERKVK